MKNIKVNKRVWKQLLQIKNKQNFSSHSETIVFLIQKSAISKGEKQSNTINPVSPGKTEASADDKLNEIYKFLED